MALSWFQRVYWTLAAAGLVYVSSIFTLIIPAVQRNATYAHRVNPIFWKNLTNVEQFGFLHHQVQQFTVTTSDNVTLSAWHILPIHLYHKHERALKAQENFGVKSFDQAVGTVGLRLLLDDPTAHAVVSFHGNAANIAAGHRPATYQQFLSVSSSEKPVHVIAFDYRGFGRSTGSPTETGVIEDGLTVVSSLCGLARVSTPSGIDMRKTELQRSWLDPSRIILVGQSLGTFVATATYHSWVVQNGQTPFNALVLLAGFTSLPRLLNSYSVLGLVPPLLSPLMGYPWLQQWFLSKLVDKWDTASRLKELVLRPDSRLDLHMMHAKDDYEIPSREGISNWDLLVNTVNGTGTLTLDVASPDTGLSVHQWHSTEGDKKITWEMVRHGGHNRIPVSEHVKLALYNIVQPEHV